MLHRDAPALFIVTLMIALFGAAQAEIPRTLNIQGILLDSGGEPVTVTSTATFTIYDAAAGGTGLWTETLPVTPDDLGRFSAVLGETTPIPAIVFDQPERWLGIQIESDPEMTPRTELTSSAYVYRSLASDTANLSLLAAPSSVNSDAIVDGTISFADFGQNGASSNYVIKWNGSAWTAAADETGGASGWTDGGSSVRLTTSTDKVGIGVSVPAEKLEVDGSAFITDKLTVGSGNVNNAGNSFVCGVNNSVTVFGTRAVISGGYGNLASDYYTVIGGGYENEATEYGAAVGGGSYNYARGVNSIIAGGGGSAGDSNLAAGGYSFIGGGSGNIAGSERSAVCSGSSNTVSSSYSLIGGGGGNTIGTSSGYAAIAGGKDNSITAAGYGTIGGGTGNVVSGEKAVISGGGGNVASDYFAVVSGGTGNEATNFGAVVGGGIGNYARGYCSVIAGGGGGSYPDSNQASGNYSVIGGGSGNIASSERSAVCAGQYNTAAAPYSFVGGGYRNTIGSYSDMATIAGGRYNSISGSFGTIGGGGYNVVRGEGAVVAGGGSLSASDSNAALGDFSAVIGGKENIADGVRSVVCGGHKNLAGTLAFTGGGYDNQATGEASTLVGGYYNEATGLCSAVPGGMNNEAGGRYSFAAGYQAKANHDGTFVWADNQVADFASTAVEQFLIRAWNGVGINTNSPSQALHVVGNICYTGTIGACSDARYKEDIETVPNALDKISRLRGVNFDWKTDEYPDHRFTGQRQLGFIAQELRTIVPEVVLEDADGYLSVDYGRLTPMLVEAIKELKTQNETKDARIDQLEAKLAKVQDLLEKLLTGRESE